MLQCSERRVKELTVNRGTIVLRCMDLVSEKKCFSLFLARPAHLAVSNIVANFAEFKIDNEFDKVIMI